MKTTPTRLTAIGLGGALLVAAGAVASFASAQSEPITACSDTKTGTLRMVSDAAQCDAKKETAVAWNVQGPAGLPGSDGPAGPQGPQGEPGHAGPPGPASNWTGEYSQRITLNPIASDSTDHSPESTRIGFFDVPGGQYQLTLALANGTTDTESLPFNYRCYVSTSEATYASGDMSRYDRDRYMTDIAVPAGDPGISLDCSFAGDVPDTFDTQLSLSVVPIPDSWVELDAGVTRR